MSPPPKNAKAPGQGRSSQHNPANSRQYPAAEISSSPVIGFMLKPSFETFLRAFQLTLSPRGGTLRNRKTNSNER